MKQTRKFKAMKKLISLFLALAMLTACAAALADTEVTVYAATSMTASLTKAADLYMAETPGVTVVLNFGSSGTLLTQIRSGAACDIFLSAAQKQMDALEADGLLADGTRCDIL